MPSRLEQYLDEVAQPVPPAHRAEWREEVRQHVEAMTEACVEMGHSRDDATEIALARFGDARTLGKQVQARIARPANTVEAMKGFIYPCSLCFALLSLYTLPRLPGYAMTGDESALAGPMAAARALLILAPMFGGWVMARRLRGRLTLRRILSGLTLGIPLCLLQIALFVLVASAFREPALSSVCAWMPAWFALAAGTAVLTRRAAANRRRQDAASAAL